MSHPKTFEIPVPPLPFDEPGWQHLNRATELRKAALRGDFAAVEAFYAEEERLFWAATDDTHTEYENLARSPMLFDFATVDAKRRVETMQAWIAEYPDSYHAHLIFGRYCQGRTVAIRTSQLSVNVSDDRWWAAHMAGEIGAVHLLRALELSQRPAVALYTMMNLCVSFGEPAWLDALFVGNQHPVSPSPPEDPANRVVYERALTHLDHYALSLPERYPTRLPAMLPSRMAVDTSASYWLRLALKARPGWLLPLHTYAAYRTERWGGERGEIENLATGPLARDLNEKQRNSLRWLVIDDLAMQGLPPPDRQSAVEEFEEIFRDWLKQDDLDNWDRFVALSRYANFASYSRDDNARAHKLHVEAVRHLHAPGFYHLIDGPFRDFAHKMLIHRFPDKEGAFKKVLEYGVRNYSEPTVLVLAAGAYQFGWWGFPVSQVNAQMLLDRAAQLAPDYEKDDFEPCAACRMAWEGGLRDEAVFLTQQLAERRVYGAAASMYDIMRGYWPMEGEMPAAWEEDKLYWLDRAVEDGAPTALYNKAWRLENVDKLDLSIRGNLERCRDLYLGSIEGGIASGHIRVASLMLRFGSPGEAKQAVVDLKSLVDTDDEELAGDAYTQIALAYKYGTGVPQSDFAAMQWVDHAEKVVPSYSGHQWLHDTIYGETSGTMVKRVLGAFFKRKINAEHLPPSFPGN